MENNYEIGQWLYIEDGNVEMLFRFLEKQGGRWVTNECYQVMNDEVYVNKGRFVITTNQEVVEPSQDKIDEILNKVQ